MYAGEERMTSRMHIEMSRAMLGLQAVTMVGIPCGIGIDMERHIMALFRVFVLKNLALNEIKK